MFPRKYKKQSKLKRFLLKLLNVYAFEKESFNLVNPNYKNNSKNYFKINDKSLILSSGYLNFKRKVKKLDIFFDTRLLIHCGILLTDGKELYQISIKKF